MQTKSKQTVKDFGPEKDIETLAAAINLYMEDGGLRIVAHSHAAQTHPSLAPKYTALVTFEEIE